MERSYLEVKVSFLHIVVMLVGIIIIGSFLFYLGYQAGKSASEPGSQQTDLLENKERPEEIQLSDAGNTQTKKEQESKKKASIDDELKLHRLPAGEEKEAPTVDEIKAVTSKPARRESYYTIQVGAFSEYANAKNYSATFAKMGYPTEILTTVHDGKNLYRVRVGQFKNRNQAANELKKLERQEKKKFALINPD